MFGGSIWTCFSTLSQGATGGRGGVLKIPCAIGGIFHAFCLTEDISADLPGSRISLSHTRNSTRDYYTLYLIGCESESRRRMSENEAMRDTKVHDASEESTVEKLGISREGNEHSRLSIA